jgi:hypothetical protein
MAENRISRITILTDRVLILRHRKISQEHSDCRERNRDEASLAVADRIARLEQNEQVCQSRQASPLFPAITGCASAL